MPKILKIILTGGGTGGHFLPLLAVVNELRKIGAERGIDFDFLYIGTNPARERALVEKFHVQYDHVAAGKMRRYFSLQNVIDVFKIPWGLGQAYAQVKKFGPDVVFGKGGYASVPVVTAAGWQHKKTLIHESDTTPGLANRRMAKYATKIALTFSQSTRFFDQSKVVVTGNPVRAGILAGSFEHCLKTFNLDNSKPILFVTGGSFGARTINRVVVAALPKLLETYQIIHQCGQVGLEEVVGTLRQKFGAVNVVQQGNNYYLRDRGYRLRPFLQLEEMADAYAGARIVISRAGASSLSEIAAVGKPSILIPLPVSASRGEQITNAAVYERAGASVVIMNEELTTEKLLVAIRQLVGDAATLTAMGQAARKLAHPEAATRIAEEIIKLAYGR